MKRITIVKVTPNRPANHLYEHLYARALTAQMRARNLFNRADYYYEATTYDAGLIYIDMTLITPAACALAKEASTIRPELTDENIGRCMDEIMIENQRIVSYDPAKLRHALKEIDEIPWQPFDAVNIFDTRGRRPPLRLVKAERKPARFPKATVTASLDTDYAAANSHAVALFWHVFDVVLAEVGHTLQRKYGSYVFGRKDHFDKMQTTMQLTLRLAKREDSTTVTAYLEREIANLLRDGIVRSLVAYVHEDFRNLPTGYIHEDDVEEDIGLVVGPQAWREFTSEGNIAKLLSHCVITFGQGGETGTAERKPILLA